MFLSIPLLLLCFSSVAFSATPEAAAQNDAGKPEFPDHAQLDENGQFQLYWKSDSDSVTFQYHAATKGWAALGFSPNGGMGGADIVLVWVDANGKGQISDRYADSNSFPPEDAKQDYTLISAARNATHIIATFSRKKNTCDTQDYGLSEDTVRLIYAANDAIPTSKDTFSKHTVRGVKSVHLFDKKTGTGGGEAPNDPDAKPYDFRVDKVHVPENESTTYWCEFAKMPKFDKKMHIIKVEPLIEKQNTDVVHHIIVYACSKDMSEFIGKPSSCFAKEGEEEHAHVSGCKQQVIAGWAVGGQASSYPDNIGYPLYHDSGDMYVMMEMHYDNTNLQKGKVDNSGMRLWITEKLRQIDSGQAMMGIPVNWDEPVIPPGVKEYTIYGYCSAGCTDGFPKDGIKVFGGILHTHLAGRKVRMAHYRNGKELPPVMADEHYDFNYQDNRRLSEPVTVLPGDELVVECVYETLDRTKTTFSGHGTHDEMCLIFMDYYPALYRGFVCFSTPDKRALYKTLGIEMVPFNASNPMSYEVAMPDGTQKKLSHYLHEDFNFDWTPEKIATFQKTARDTKHTVVCLREDIEKPGFNQTDEHGKVKGFDLFEQHGYPNITERLVVNDACSNTKKQQSDNQDAASGSHQQPGAPAQAAATGTPPSAQPLRERNAAARSVNQCGVIEILVTVGLVGLIRSIL